MTKLGVSASDLFRGQGNNTKYCQTGLIELRLNQFKHFLLILSLSLFLSFSISHTHTGPSR